MSKKTEPKRVSRLGLDDRSFGERAAGLVNRVVQPAPVREKKTTPAGGGFGEPAGFTEAQRTRLKKLREQARKPKPK